MKMKRFVAANMQQALKQIREELGPDAVILSSQKVEGGTEVVGALNYDEEAEREHLAQDDKASATPAQVAKQSLDRQVNLEQAKQSIKSKLEATRERLNQAQHGQPPGRKARASNSLQASHQATAQRGVPSHGATRQAVPQHRAVQPPLADNRADQHGSSRVGAHSVSGQGTEPLGSFQSSTGPTEQSRTFGTVGTESTESTAINLAVNPSANENNELAVMKSEIMELRAMLKQQSQEAAAEKQDFSEILRSLNAPTGLSSTNSTRSGSRTLADFPAAFQNKYSKLGLLPEMEPQLLTSLDPTQEQDVVWRNLLAVMTRGLCVQQEELIDRTGCFVLVGPTGVGKTTTIAKMAARYVLKYGPQSIALVSTDRFRVAASQQLQSVGRLLNVPVLLLDPQQSLDDVLDRLSDKRLVLVDTAGLHPQDVNWSLQTQDLQVERHRISNYLVVSAVTQAQVMKSNFHHYKALNISACIVTKLDEACSLGEVISLATLSQMPVAYFTDGQEIPKDLHPAKASALVVRAVALAQQQEAELSAGLSLTA